MTSKIGVNLRVTGDSSKGDRHHMEDMFSVAYEQDERGDRLEFAYFGIFDGHGGREAALYAKDHLMDNITCEAGFWSTDDQSVLQAIRHGFLRTHSDMWREAKQKWRPNNLVPWPNSGTTASVVFIKRGKLFIGHCGDSGILVGFDDDERGDKPQGMKTIDTMRWKSLMLTKDHKPEDRDELARITRCGGLVIKRKGVHRVAWSRPATHSTENGQHPDHNIVHSPVLSVARSLGDFWSYNARSDSFVVSPEPDVHVFKLDPGRHRCLLLATDGVWNVLRPDEVVQEVLSAELNNTDIVVNKEGHNQNPEDKMRWLNPSKSVVELATQRWRQIGRRADNATVVTVLLDPPGDSRETVLKRLHNLKTTATILSTSSYARRKDEPVHLNGSTIMAKSPEGTKFAKSSTLKCDGDNNSHDRCNKVKRVVSDSEAKRLQLILVSRPLPPEPSWSSSPPPPPLPRKSNKVLGASTSSNEKPIIDSENRPPLKRSATMGRVSRRSLPQMEPKLPMRGKMAVKSPSPPPIPRKTRRSESCKVAPLKWPHPPCSLVTNAWSRTCVIHSPCPVHSSTLGNRPQFVAHNHQSFHKGHARVVTAPASSMLRGSLKNVIQ